MTYGMILWRIKVEGYQNFARDHSKTELREFFKTVFGIYPRQSLDCEGIAYQLWEFYGSQVRTDSLCGACLLGKQTRSDIEDAVLNILHDKELYRNTELVEKLYPKLYDCYLPTGRDLSDIVKGMREDIPTILELSENVP